MGSLGRGLIADEAYAVKLGKAASKIQAKFSAWYEKRILKRYTVFLAKGHPVHFNFLLKVRIFRKKRACHIIKDFMAYLKKKEEKNVSRVVRAFMSKVRFIQKLMRNFIVCRKARLFVMAAKWQKIESKYILEYIARRRGNSEKMNGGNAADKSARLAIEKQSARLERTQTELADLFDTLRLKGSIRSTTESENFDKLRLPVALRNFHVEKILYQNRKDYLLEMKTSSYPTEDSSIFSVSEACAFLKPGSNHVDIILNKKPKATDVQKVSSHKEFRLFGDALTARLENTIRAEYLTSEVFAANSNIVQAIRMKMNKAKKK